MTIIKVILTGVAIIATCLSALYWYASSRVPVAPFWVADARYAQPGEHSATQESWIAAMRQSLSETSRLNKIAASWTAIATALNATVTLISWFS
jgi:hypothetical protein